MFSPFARVVLILAVSGGLTAAYAGLGEGADFSGTWVFNVDESEMPGPPPGRGGPPPGEGQRGTDGERGPGGRGGRRGMRGPMGMISKMTVTQTEDQITVVAEGPQGGSRERVYKPGAGPQEESTPRGDITVEARWEGQTLVLTTHSVRETQRGEVKIEQTQRWEMSEDGQTLTQNQEIQTPFGTREMKMVFNREEAH